ncbi:TIGR04283 family arsenosugar biosynthesis glycosyltransferase [Nodosilinea nodulosa]|uniref:TIGR04283 family arsenosugar biosynthesis glycosyltransferase n=1 Tax=Nodosilinea nodulosa TaxID=416001 RepID=UPI0002DA5D27|nr:TIGR04283 family arsenosugar biosynthesis glycosyltransferase [Nodosilinea nodulosa]
MPPSVEGRWAGAEWQTPTITIVIPALNEAGQLPAVLGAICAAAPVEVVVVDGGSTDGTAEVAQARGARVVKSTPGRSRQQNQGARVAKGSILLFLHADTRPPEGFDQAIRQILAQPGVVAGAFTLAIDSPRRGLRWVEWGVKVRSRLLQMPYGDQGIFLRAETFHRLGGFPDLPMMEDFELVRRLRKLGRVAIAPAAVVTSDRRWRRLGILRTTLANQVMVIGYLLGVNPHWLAQWYRHLGKLRS